MNSGLLKRLCMGVLIGLSALTFRYMPITEVYAQSSEEYGNCLRRCARGATDEQRACAAYCRRNFGR